MEVRVPCGALSTRRRLEAVAAGERVRAAEAAGGRDRQLGAGRVRLGVLLVLLGHVLLVHTIPSGFLGFT